MGAHKRTIIALTVLGLVSAGVIAFLIWIYLAPPQSMVPVQSDFTSEVRTDVISNDKFRGLKPYADLPIKPVNVGRPDPFEPLPETNDNANANLNINAR